MKRGQPLQRKTPLRPKTPLTVKVALRARSPMRKRRPKSTPMRQAARGRDCYLNVAGVCTYDAARVSLTHFRWLGNCGTGIKPSDAQGCPGCDACNRWTDSPTPQQVEACGGRVHYERDRNFYAARALARLRDEDQQPEAA
jgi:hypothetical protein